MPYIRPAIKPTQNNIANIHIVIITSLSCHVVELEKEKLNYRVAIECVDLPFLVLHSFNQRKENIVYFIHQFSQQEI
jgi:hypothetical protein